MDQQFRMERDLLQKLVDGYEPSSFGGDEVERKAASDLLTAMYQQLQSRLQQRIYDKMAELLEARGGILDDDDAEFEAQRLDACAVVEVYGVDDRECCIVIMRI